jgi:hypothetical protein
MNRCEQFIFKFRQLLIHIVTVAFVKNLTLVVCLGAKGVATSRSVLFVLSACFTM